jgi:hypothetical protein
MLGLIDRVDVYTGARFTTLARGGLRCRVAHVNVRPAATGMDRAELAALRNLIWEPGYAMPEGAQVRTADGVRWNIIAGTLKALRGPTGAVTYRQCDIKRAVNG